MSRAIALSMLSLFITGALIASSVTAAPPASAATVHGAGTYEGGSAAISFTGTWTTLPSSGSSGGSVRYATSATASASLTFAGGGTIAWYTWNSPWAGIVDVYLDGAKVARVDNYAPVAETGIIGFKAATAPGTHTIKIVGSGSNNWASLGEITHLDSFVVGVDRSTASTPAKGVRAADCPAATTTVRTAGQLSSAMANAAPGTVIRLADGYYTGGGFELRRSGTATRPIWICGGPLAVVEGWSVSEGVGLRLDGVEHVRVTGFTVTRVLQGILVKHSSDVVISDMTVKDTGYEGIHLYAFTTDSVVTHNTVVRTGVRAVAYGEGVYIGTSQRRWDDVTGGVPDRSDGNTVTYNAIKASGAEGIEAKEGTTGGVIAYNTFEGHQDGSRAWGWVLINGNDWTVAANTGIDAVEDAYASMAWGDWGRRNEFIANRGTANASGYGVWVQDRQRGVTVTCDNSIKSAGKGLTNVYCSP
ncbi:NosD domain-containing protein [Microbacterium sp. NPDC019599]|uniref:NosD domain-containing protein n=1 Tax=Microbacterium sp. NPDC019599 TaxID=3154690 RepID=UPI003403C9E4